MANSLPKTLAFRHTFVSSVMKENVVSLFGEIGSEFELGTDYDAEILYKVSSSELSNLFNYYNGGLLNSQVVLPNGSVGSADLSSLLSVNAQVTSNSIKPYNTGYVAGTTGTLTEQNSKEDGGQYYLGDVVLFSPDPGADPSCWTCIRTTSSPTSPIPLRGTVAAGQINRDAVPGSTFQYAGFYGSDKNSQNFIQGVKPAYYTSPSSTSTNITPTTHPDATLVYNSEYWKESAIARSYNKAAIYYAGEIVTFSGGVYECISTQGDAVTPSLFLNPTPASALTTITLSTSLEALNGSYGADFSGQRYIQNVPPSGGVNSPQFWKPGSYRKLPTTVYANLNWSNFDIKQKINQYDANITGGNGAQTIPSFTDDAGSKVVTLRKIYDDNEKGFIMDVATSILARIPAAAIKAQVVGQRPTPDSSLAEMVLAGPHWTYPDNYAPAVQGVFEEAVYRDMLQVSGTPTAITDFVVSTGSEGYFQDGSTGRPSVELIEQLNGKSVLATNPLNCTYSINNRVYARCGISRVFVDKSKASYVLDTKSYATGDVVTFTMPYQEKMFFIPPAAVVNGVDSNGKILSVTVTNPGDGILGLPTLSCNGTSLSYLVPFAKVTSLASAFLPVDTKVNSWGFSADEAVTVLQGTGSGATGHAVITTGPSPAVTTKYGTDLTVSFDTALYPTASRGSGYLGPPNNAYKQDLVMLTSAGGGRLPAVVTKVDTNGGILEVELLQQGVGYLNAPRIQLGRPPSNPLDTADVCDPVTGATGGVTISEAGLLGVTLQGRYTLKNNVGDTVLPRGYVTGIGSTYGGIYPHMGVNYVDVLYGGLGFKENELLDVVGSVTPALFTVNSSSAGGTFLTSGYGGTTGVTLNIVNGGNGYVQDQYLVLDGPTAGVELLARVTRLGGNVKSVSFQSSDLVGVSFSVGQLLDLSDSEHSDTTTGDALKVEITSVGAGGQLYDAAQQSGGATSLAYSNVSGTTKVYTQTGGFTGETFNVQDQLVGVSLYSTIESISVSRSGAVYTTANPTLTISDPTGNVHGALGFTAVTATATPVLGLNGIGVTGAKGSNFASGDFIYINQLAGVGGAATSAKAVVLQVDDAGAPLALGVEGTGQNFDVAGELQYTTTGDGAASDGTTGGATFDAMFSSFFTIVRVDMTNRGLGYTAPPTVTLTGTSRGVAQVFSPVTQSAGAGALFRLTSFDLTTTPPTFTVKLLDRGVGYITGDVIDFYGPLLSTPGYKQGHGMLALVDTVVGGNVLTADLDGPGTLQGTFYKPGAYTKPLAVGTNNPTNASYDLKFRVLTVGDPSAISGLDVVQSRGAYATLGAFTHKKLATVTVKSVDTFGKILSLEYEPGYGYRGIPVVKPKASSAGVAALFNVPYMGVSRVENAFYKDSFDVENVVINPPITLLPATAYATIPGDLYPISVDLFKNPNILDTLETIKPGSTTGYAQGKAVMSVQNVFVKHSGKSLGNLLSTSGGPGLTITISPPDLSAAQGGVQATAFVQSSGWDSTLQRILAVTIPNDGHGSGYLKPPTITVTLADGNISDDMPILVAQMAISGVNVTSRGLGFGNAPGAQISDSDVTPGLHATVTSTTLKKTLTQFDIIEPGAQYLEIPNVNVISQGTGQLGYVRTAITDIQVLGAGAGFKVGDVLEFGHFGTTGLTLTYDGATGVPGFVNSPPPSDRVFDKGTYGGANYQPTDCAQACVSEIDSLGGIVSVVINYNPWSPSKDKYGLDTKVLSKNDVQYGGLGYGYPEHFDTVSGLTYLVETLPRVVGFYRPDEYGARDYFTEGTTLASSSTVPWIDPTDGTIKKGATFLNASSVETNYLTKLALDTTGTTLLSDLYTAGTVRLPKIETRLGVKKFDVWTGKEGEFHVNDAQILVESPPESQQARYVAVRNATTNTITSYSRQSAGLGYTSVPKVTIVGGGGEGANATARMGVGEVKILDGGSGYSVGDVVNFPGPSGGTPASGVVTVVDGGVLAQGKQATFRFAAVDTTTPISWNPSTLKVEGWGATGTAVLVNKGFGYRAQDIISAEPQPIYNTWLDNNDNYLWQAPMFPKKDGVDGPDIGSGYMYTWGNITATALFNQELGLVFGLRPAMHLRGSGQDAYGILMVNAILTKTERLIAVYDDSGSLITPANANGLSAYSYQNFTSLGDRTGLITATTSLSYYSGMGQYSNPKGIPGVELPFPTFRFMGWSDGDAADETRYGYTWWYNITQGPVDYKRLDRTPAQFRVDNIDDQANGSVSVSLINGGSGGFFDSIYTLEGNQSGVISYINLLEKGSGYTSVPESSGITITRFDGTPSGSGAKLYSTLSLVELTATTPGSLYFSAPTVYVDPPVFRSLKPQLYARSAEILYQNGSYFDWESAEPALKVITTGEGYVESGIYQLVVDDTVGGLHQTGNASFSVDTLLMLGDSGNLTDPLDLTSDLDDTTTRYGIKDTFGGADTLLQKSIYIRKGSNYRVNELYKLIPYGRTPSLSTSTVPGVAAQIKILKVSNFLDNEKSQIYGSGNNDYIGILDEGKVLNGEDVGGYGTGYLTIPKIRIVGGPQGVVMAPSLGLTKVDFVAGNRGTNYNVNDEIWAEAPEFGSVIVGKVSKVITTSEDGVTKNGVIAGVNLYTPYKQGLRSLPKLTVVRKGAFVAGSTDAQLIPSMGISQAAITANTDGFVGEAFIQVDFPGGKGYTVQPKEAIIEPRYVFMVDQVAVDPNGNSSSPVLYEKAPIVKFDIPPFINTYSGWNGVYFAPGDAFEIVVQYTIAKAVAFQVDPDVTLPGKYLEADSITIGGVTIPLRKPGAASSQGREVSQNRVVYKYLVKFQAA
jgi:hypothetical protein